MLDLISLLGNYVEIAIYSGEWDTDVTDASIADSDRFLFYILNQILRSVNLKRKSNFISH